MTPRWERVDLDAIDEQALRPLHGRSVFQTTAWLGFLQETQGAEPVVARLIDDGVVVGWFVGTRFVRWGAPILASPLPTTMTSHQGFLSNGALDRSAALVGLKRFARSLRCVHVEVLDRYAPPQLPRGYESTPFHSMEIPLDDDEHTMLHRMRPNTRRNVGTALRRGVHLETIDPADDRATAAFAVDLADQIVGAAQRRGTAPALRRDRIDAAIRHLGPTGDLLLLRAHDDAGRTAATGMFPGLSGHAAYFWTGGSDPDLWLLRPNELLMWEALRTWRSRGATVMDLGGGGYKRRYGAVPTEVPWLRASLVPGVATARRLAERRHRRRRQTPTATA